MLINLQKLHCSVHYKSSAIAEMARVFSVNLDHCIVENPILDAIKVDFYGTTTLRCPSLNPVVGPYELLVKIETLWYRS